MNLQLTKGNIFQVCLVSCVSSSTVNGNFRGGGGDSFSDARCLAESQSTGASPEQLVTTNLLESRNTGVSPEQLATMTLLESRNTGASPEQLATMNLLQPPARVYSG